MKRHSKRGFRKFIRKAKLQSGWREYKLVRLKLIEQNIVRLQNFICNSDFICTVEFYTIFIELKLSAGIVAPLGCSL